MKLRVTNILLLMEIGDANSWIRRCHWNFQMFVGWTTHGFLVFHVGGFRWVQHAPLECGNHFPILLRKKGCSSIPVAFPATGELGARDSAGSDKVHDICLWQTCVWDDDNELTRDHLAHMCVVTLDGKLLDPGSPVRDQVENMSHLRICWRHLCGFAGPSESSCHGGLECLDGEGGKKGGTAGKKGDYFPGGPRTPALATSLPSDEPQEDPGLVLAMANRSAELKKSMVFQMDCMDQARYRWPHNTRNLTSCVNMLFWCDYESLDRDAGLT